MAKITDLKFAYQVFMKAYPYRRIDWHPGAWLEKPLPEARVAVVAAAAFFRRDQPPFDTTIRGGDYSYRVIPSDTDLSTLEIAHRRRVGGRRESYHERHRFPRHIYH
jgi:D-proline reductase (dithiol) PrdB